MKRRIICFAGNRLGSIDVILPLLIELKLRFPDVEISMYFVTRQTWDQLRDAPFLFQEVCRVVDHFIHIYDKLGVFKGRKKHLEQLCEEQNWWDRLCVHIVLAKRILTAKRLLMLRAVDMDSSLMKRAYLLSQLRKGRFYQHFQSHIIMPPDRNPGRAFAGLEGDGFLAFAPCDNPFLKRGGWKKISCIGYTRLYKCWQDRLREGGPNFFQQESKRLNIPADLAVVSLFLSSTLEGVFSNEELTEWLLEVFNAVRSVVGDVYFLLKPHPVQDMDPVKKALDMATGVISGVSYLHAGVLASNSAFVVIHHTSTIFEAYSANTPIIQHMKMTKHWLARHKEGSAFLQLGHPHTQNREELVQAVREVTASGYKMPVAEHALGQIMDISVLLEALR